MQAYEKVRDKKIVIFEIDDVLFPQKDYLLQVYYLFAQFIEYIEQKSATDILEFMRKSYTENGPENLFQKTAVQFDLDLKYQHNFDLLHQNARLPLKLLLYQNMLTLLQELVVDRKQIFIVTAGDPEQQLNKIKQMEWNGLEKYLTVYFSDELKQPKSAIFKEILNQCNITTDDALVVGANKSDEYESKLMNLSYLVSPEIYM